MADLRLFIAAEITDDIRSRLAELIDSLSSPKDGVKWVKPASVHLTLKFLGNVKEEDLDRVIATGKEALSGFRGLDDIQLSVGDLGAFPGGKRIRVIWVGLGGEIDRLGGLRDALEGSFSKLGFPTEERSFKPHLTIGRVKGRANQEIVERIEGMKNIVLGNFKVSGLHLFKSDLRPTGAVYASLAYYSFS